MRIGHCQLECVAGDFEANLASVVRGLERAEAERLEIVSFPECFLTGYQDQEEEVRRHAFAVDSPAMRAVLERTRRFTATLIVGLNELRGDDLYNTALGAHRDELLGTYSKCSADKPFHR